MTEITLDPLVVAAIGGALIPLITGLITKYQSATGVKAITALVLAVAVGALTAVTEDGSFTLDEVAEAALLAFGTNVTTYLGIWKPIGNTDAVPGQMLWPDRGLGKPTPDDGDP